MKQIKKIKDLLKAFELGIEIRNANDYQMFADQLHNYYPDAKFYCSDEDYEKLKPKKDDWIKWSGGECPVDDKELVRVKYRDGEERNTIAKLCCWEHQKDDIDIIAYKLQYPKKSTISKNEIIEIIPTCSFLYYTSTEKELAGKLNEVIKAVNKLMENKVVGP